MRSFKSKVLSAAAWALPTLAAALPLSRDVDVHHHPKPSVLELALHQNYAQATFRVPCPGCLGEKHTDQDDDSLILSFKAHSSDEPCGTSNITLNGVYLPQEWNGDLATGSGSFSGVTDIEKNEWLAQHDLDLEWESACLSANASEETDLTSNDVAQVFTVTIKGVDGKPLDKPSGFTISYKQLSPPELLRLERKPNPSAKDVANAESWREPPPHLRLLLPSVSSSNLTASGQVSLEDEIRELRALQAEAAKLHKAIKAKQVYINSQLKKEANSLRKDLKDCENITCVLKTVAHKAKGAWRVVYVRFRPAHHPHHPAPDHNMGRPDDYARLDNHKQSPEAGFNTASLPPPIGATHDNPFPPPPPPKHPLVFTLEIVVGILCCGCLVTLIRHRCSSLRTRTDRAATREERRNARAYRHAARRLAWTNWWKRTSWRDQDRIADYEEKRALINSQESVLESAMQQEIRQLRTAHDLVNDLVSQAEQGRMPPREYPHNLPPIQAQQPHVCTCRHARPSYPVQPTPYSPTSSTYSHSSLAHPPSRPISRSSSLPGYGSDTATEPPAYESDEDATEFVANGFRYVPTSGDSTSVDSPLGSRSIDGGSVSERWTPDSSVVDVSPRPSADTLRYVAFAEREGDGARPVSAVGEDVKN
ncbi:hypothetical protein B0J11DRAFT_272929 [Dendryphion nanum]|uniref:Uncharacterized protein n=1 Tax=Dendryphion nanum TaxID=256645 RepID=A0A9P9E0A3_9PLEO|nr:hypothetical protein B0J11DRAFT_272929 [Dendryphion nanum]